MQLQKNIFAFTLMLLVFAVLETSARNVHHQIPFILNRINIPYFWHLKDDGGFVPAFLSGSPRETLADERDVRFYLFTPKNPSTHQQLFTANLAVLDASNFDSDAPVKIFLHGFASSSVGGSSGAVKAAYLSHLSNVNVILIDWAPLAKAPWYDKAAANTRLVGQVASRFIEFLVDNRRTTLAQIDLAGHSLGAHICGFIGSELLMGKPPRIVALDPALPLFGGVSKENRLDPSDAQQVQVIHTSGGEFAFMDPLGDVDFYPNGGRNQPGCSGLPAEVVGACSHSRAYEFFVESIRMNGFNACKCSSWSDFSTCNCATTIKMGEYTPASATGYYYVRTNGSPPYAQASKEF